MIDLRVILAITRQALRLAARNRAFVVTATIIPVNYLFLFLLTVINGAQAPTDLVVDGAGGPAVERFVRELRATDSFEIHRVDQVTARRQFDAGRVVAMIVVPDGFDAEVARGRQPAVAVSIRNLDTDFTDDIRRGLAMAIQRFGAKTEPSVVDVVPEEHDDAPREVPYLPYVLVSIVVVAIMIGGLFQGGVNVAREYELGTIAELALAPTSRLSVLLGILAGTFVVSGLGTLAVVGLLVTAFGIRPVHWLALLGACALMQATCAAGGVLIGTLFRRRNGLGSMAILLSLPMLSLSGAFYPAVWSDPVIAAIAPFTPTYYASGLFHYVVEGTRTTPVPIWTDALVLAALGAGLMAAAAAVFRRQEVRA